MTMHDDTHRRIEGVLDREIEAAHSLSNALQVERTALTGASAEAVTAVAAQKVELFAAIEQLEAQRRELCAAASLSFPNLRAGRLPIIAGVSQTLADRWRSLLELIAGCRIANEVNGFIINARRGQVNQLLQILRGGTPLTYGPTGRTQSSQMRALARA
jgi:flagellar biosynthesis/type III secretory pathway chaperone